MCSSSQCPVCGENPTITAPQDIEFTCALPQEKAASVSAAELERILAAPPAGLCVLDVREPWEHLLIPWPQATHRIPSAELTSRRSEVPAGCDVIFVCSVGERRAEAVRHFNDRGGTSDRHLKNGLHDFLP